MESAGIPDLGQDRGRVVRRFDAAERGGTEAASSNGRTDVVRLIELHAIEVATDFETASHRLEVRIDKFTNHDDLSKEFVSVNNIWLEASQCLTARVDA